MTPTLLLTRPKGRNAPFAAAIKAVWDGPLAVVTSPLLEITFLAATPPVADALIFTSVNGVAAATHLGLRGGQRAFCVGGRTAQAASNAGFVTETGPGDAAGLLAHLLDAQPTGSLAHIRGRHARGDLAHHLNAGGLICQDVVAYDQLACDLSPEAQTALVGENPVILPLFSPRTATILKKQGAFLAPQHYVAMSDAVSDALPPADVAKVTVARSPDADAMRDGVLAVLRALTVR